MLKKILIQRCFEDFGRHLPMDEPSEKMAAWEKTRDLNDEISTSVREMKHEQWERKNEMTT